MTSLQLTFLGQVSATIDQATAFHFPMKSVTALLVYLAEHGPEQRHEREMLAELLWPGMAPKYGRKNLRQTLYELNKLLPELDGGPLIITTRNYLQRNPQAAVDIDTQRFEQALQDPSVANLKEALTYYQGDFLADFYLPDSTAFENWAQNRRAYYRQRYRQALHSLITLNPGDTASYARRLLESDPLDEDAARQLMATLAEQGERAEALKFFEQFREQLQAEVDIEVSPETRALAASIRAGEPLPTATPPARLAVPQEAGTVEFLEQTPALEIRHNLPFQLTPFFGRKAELAALDVFIADPDVRLVTIVGAGGMGKTRLALACAQRYVTTASLFPGGVFFVDLAPLSEVEQITLALADALDLPLLGDDRRSPQQQLLDFLRHKKMLLIFDNFEHLPAGADLVRDVLLDAHEMQILVTSRERLNLRAEQVYAIEGLAFSDREAAALVTAEVEDSAAVQLFRHAARRVQPDFDLYGRDDRAVLVRICHLVGGMPLALELAAAWVELLPLAEIAAELQQGLDFLETEMRDLPERHRSLRAVIDYSWQRLDEKEQDIFAQLSVFRGGFTREAAQAVAGANLQQLARLVNKSLLQGGGQDGRYHVHGLLHRFGAEQLAGDREKDASVRERHSHFFCTILQETEAELKSARQITAIATIEADYLNILAGWNEALDQGNLALLVKAVNGLGEFHDAAGRWGEGIATMEKSAEKMQALYGQAPISTEGARLIIWLWAWRVSLSKTISAIMATTSEQPLVQGFLLPAWDLLAHPVLVSQDTRAEKAFIHLLFGRIYHWTAEYEKSREHLGASLNLYKTLNDRFHVAEALLSLSLSSGQDEGYRQLKESLTVFQQAGEPRRLVLTLCLLAHETKSSASAEPGRYLDEAFAIAREAKYDQGMLETHLQTADTAWYRGQFDLALAHNKEALVYAEKLHNPILWGACSGHLALTQMYRGQFSQALSLLKDAVELNPDNWTKDMLPMVHLHAGNYETAESLLVEGREYLSLSTFPWIRILQAVYAEALSLTQKIYDQYPLGEREHRAWTQVPMAYAFYKLDRLAEARQTLVQCLQTCLEIQAFLPLMQLMPIIPVVLADGVDERLQERAVELYALAASLPFVNKSQLFADLAGKPMADVASMLPADVAAAAQTRGRALEWWPTAEILLSELKELGWG